jgi:hypothetical protein
MFKLVYFALIALAAVPLVNGAAILRRTPPSAWNHVLENYGSYHARSLAIGCQNKRGTQFFDDCCHPMKRGETLEKNRKPHCRPGNNSSSTSATLFSSLPPVNVAEPSSPTPEPTPSPDGNDDGDDDCEDPEYSTDVPPSTPSPTPAPSESPNPTPAPSPAQPSSSNNPEPSPASDGGSDVHTGGFATWFTQNGVAGACGTVHSDSDLIAALDYRTYGDLSSQSSYCGQKIRVTWQGKSVDVVVADACPTCNNAASVDLSQGAFESLADLSVGQLDDITWETI